MSTDDAIKVGLALFDAQNDVMIQLVHPLQHPSAPKDATPKPAASVTILASEFTASDVSAVNELAAAFHVTLTIKGRGDGRAEMVLL